MAERHILTTCQRLASFVTVSASHPENVRCHRLTATALLLFVFFLPLHIHLSSSTPQFANECSCLHGVKTQAGPALAPATWTPVLQIWSIVSYRPQPASRLPVRSHSTRAPPAVHSL